MRVCFVTHYHTLYGANRSLLNLVDGLTPLGVVCHVIAPRQGPITEELAKREIPCVIAPMEFWVSVPEVAGFGGIVRKFELFRASIRKMYKNHQLLPGLVRRLKAWQIDMVYSNSSVTPLGAMLASRLRCRHIWHLREFCDLHYGFHYDFGKWLTQATIRRADALIAISRAIAHYYTGGAECSHMHLIYNGVLSREGFDILYQESRAKTSPTGQYSFAVLGKLCAAKGQETAVHALKLLAHDFPQARLLIAGEGEMEPLVRLAGELGLADKVCFLGYVSDPYQVYRQADALLVCSRYEAMGRVTVEAMTACLPVIGYNQAGTSEIIEHERTGLLYRGGPAELASCMRRFLNQPEWSEQLGRNGWSVARSRFCIEDYAERIHSVLLNLLQPNPES